MRKPVRAQGKVEARIDRMGGRGGKEQKGRNYPAVPYLELVLYKVKCNVLYCRQYTPYCTIEFLITSPQALTHSNRPINHSVRKTAYFSYFPHGVTRG